MGRLGELAKTVSGLRPPPAPTWARYVGAPLAVALATALQHVLLPQPELAPFEYSYFGVALAAWVGGRIPGLIAALLGALAVNYHFIVPFHALSLSNPAGAATLHFVVTASLVAMICGSLRTAVDTSEDQARLLRLSDDAIFTWRAGGVIESWNRGAAALYGFTEAEAIGEKPHELLSIEIPVPLHELRSALHERGVWEGEARHRAKDGRDVVVLSRLQLVRDREGHKRVLEVNRDITERKRAEQALRESAADLNRAQAVAQTGSWRLDVKRNALLWSDETHRIFGIPRSTHFPYEMFLAAVHPEDRRRVDQAWQAALHGAAYDIEHRIVVGSEIKWVRERAELERDSQGVLVGGFGTVQDVTQRRRIENALREADRRKNEFIAMLSHELRNPLTPIRNSLYVLERARPGGEQARRALAVIDRQLTHVKRLVDDLLDVTRISHGKIRLQRHVIDLRSLVRRVVEDYEAVFADSGVNLTVELSEQSMLVDADETRLAQSLGNLLQNAAKFTPVGGSTAVTAAAVGPEAEIRVRDTGVGMTPDLLVRLFEPFMQADMSLDRGAGGLGLGLALAKALIERHGGTLTAGSEGRGKGSEFTVRLPLTKVTAAPVVDISRGVPAGKRVLVIEDVTDAAESLREVLVLNGHTVEVAYDGRAGLEKAFAFRPDVILCDIGLPVMDGYAVARAIRADQRLRGVLLIAVTGYAAPEDLQRATEAGFDLHVPKPPDIEMLERALFGRSQVGA